MSLGVVGLKRHIELCFKFQEAYSVSSTQRKADRSYA